MPLAHEYAPLTDEFAPLTPPHTAADKFAFLTEQFANLELLTVPLTDKFAHRNVREVAS